MQKDLNEIIENSKNKDKSKLKIALIISGLIIIIWIPLTLLTIDRDGSSAFIFSKLVGNNKKIENELQFNDIVFDLPEIPNEIEN